MIGVLIEIHKNFGKDVEVANIRLEEGRLEILLNETPPVDKIPNMVVSDKTGTMNWFLCPMSKNIGHYGLFDKYYDLSYNTYMIVVLILKHERRV